MGYARAFFIGRYYPEPLATMDDEIARFHSLLEGLARHLDRGTPLTGANEEELLEGPFCDAMTHAGQLAMPRRLAGVSAFG